MPTFSCSTEVFHQVWVKHQDHVLLQSDRAVWGVERVVEFGVGRYTGFALGRLPQAFGFCFRVIVVFFDRNAI